MAYDIETRCIHGEETQEEHPFGALSVPIFQTATFSHPGIGETTGHNYTRESNPTRDELERLVSSLEGAIDTVACSSGMAAIRLCMELFDLGDHIICTDDLYGGSVRLFDSVGKTHGLEFSYVDTSDIEQIKAAIKPNTAAFYIETPSNPTMKVTDLEAVIKLAKEHNIYVAVDNTFLTPYFQNPLKLGADAVIHSGTKYLGGHNDTLAGFFSTNNEYVANKLRFLYKTTGSNLSPFDSFLLIRGIKTLGVRMEKSSENAMKIAQWMKEQEKIEEVFYVGLPEHPGYEINKKQARGAGGMISFRVDSKETAERILERVKLIAFAESLGGVESLITYPMTQTHADVPLEIREKLGITDTLLRISVGIESVDDLIADLNQALNGEE